MGCAYGTDVHWIYIVSAYILSNILYIIVHLFFRNDGCDNACESAAVPDSAQGTGESGGNSTDTKEIEAEEKRLSFVGCGDNIVYYGNVREAAAVAQPGGRQYNFAPTYSQVAPIVSAADISFINQETLMAGAYG